MTPFNEHMRLAQAMLHGHLYIDPAPPWMEHVTIHGHDYILHPPLSAILSVPFALVGIQDPRVPSVLLGLMSIGLVYLITESGWLVAFFAFGTTFCYEATLGASWNFALVASTPFTLLAIAEVTRNERFNPHFNFEGAQRDYARPVLVGLWAGIAALARYDLVLAFPVYLWLKRDWRVLWGLGLWAAVYIWYNEVRFGTLTDISLQLWYAHDNYRFVVGDHGTFSAHYLPTALYNLALAGPALSLTFPWFRPLHFGQSLFSLSPALLRVKPSSKWLLAAALCSIPALTVYANGFSQLGARYYTQVMPFLLMAMSEVEVDANTKALIVVSIVSCSYFGAVARMWGLS